MSHTHHRSRDKGRKKDGKTGCGHHGARSRQGEGCMVRTQEERLAHGDGDGRTQRRRTAMESAGGEQREMGGPWGEVEVPSSASFRSGVCCPNHSSSKPLRDPIILFLMFIFEKRFSLPCISPPHHQTPATIPGPERKDRRPPPLIRAEARVMAVSTGTASYCLIEH